MRVTLDIVRSRDGRLEGTAATEAGPQHPFSGTLELLRILDDLEPAPRADTAPGGAR